MELKGRSRSLSDSLDPTLMKRKPFLKSWKLRKTTQSQNSLFGSFSCSSLGSQILQRFFHRKSSKSCQHAKSYVIQTLSDDFPHLGAETGGDSAKTPFVVDKYKLVTPLCNFRSSSLDYMYYDLSSDSSLLTTSSSSSCGSYSVATKEDSVSNRLDKQLVQLENLVRSLEELEKKIIHEHSLDYGDSESGGRPSSPRWTLRQSTSSSVLESSVHRRSWRNGSRTSLDACDSSSRGSLESLILHRTNSMPSELPNIAGNKSAHHPSPVRVKTSGFNPFHSAASSLCGEGKQVSFIRNNYRCFGSTCRQLHGWNLIMGSTDDAEQLQKHLISW